MQARCVSGLDRTVRGLKLYLFQFMS
ncbi:TPA: hypothetical protein ANIA_11293 [Aspergillus nidulans FGSC A4]|uniref:Uncharacterized protein n=1 Tax=Emericella nidulans (strain FGSC A4 / ATCC 38163 / CBS 112.46 / NRRL 194 / M139) TaxID=227321 RepID=C8VTN5_EMENI|nr:TPA: hypothetical protein ANIA_11293 [Aspergillus nidulans FGSC A4]